MANAGLRRSSGREVGCRTLPARPVAGNESPIARNGYTGRFDAVPPAGVSARSASRSPRLVSLDSSTPVPGQRHQQAVTHVPRSSFRDHGPASVARHTSGCAMIATASLAERTEETVGVAKRLE